VHNGLQCVRFARLGHAHPLTLSRPYRHWPWRRESIKTEHIRAPNVCRVYSLSQSSRRYWNPFVRTHWRFCTDHGVCCCGLWPCVVRCMKYHSVNGKNIYYINQVWNKNENFSGESSVFENVYELTLFNQSAISARW